MEGWIKLHRKITDHWIWKNSNYVHAWITILFTVNYEPKKTLIQGEIIECDRGQSLLSLQNWTELFGRNWTIQKTRTFFDLLKNDSMINTEGLRKTTRLTVCKYNDYQDQKQADNTPKTSTEQGDNKEITTTKESKESKEIKNIAEFYPFEEFWNDYGKKDGAKKCKEKWNRISKSDRKLIKEFLPKYIKSTPDIQYRKNPSTFLNNECWNDEIIVHSKKKQISKVSDYDTSELFN